MEDLGLRLIILAIGLVIIALIYWMGTRRKRPRGGAVRARRGTRREARARAAGPEPEPVDDPEADEEPFLGDDEDVLPDPDAPDGDEGRGVGGRRAAPAAPAPGVPAMRATGEPVDTPLADTSVYRPPDADAPYRPAAPPTAAPTPRAAPEPSTPSSPAPGGISSAPPAGDRDAGGPGEAAPGAGGGESAVNVVLLVRAAAGRPFAGPELLALFRERGYTHSRRQTFEYSHGDQERSVFGVGHLLEPGVFELQQIGDLRTPGLVMFMNLPGPLPAAVAVDLMLDEAVELAQRLGGGVCDERGGALSLELQNKLREEAAEYDRHYGMPPARDPV